MSHLQEHQQWTQHRSCPGSWHYIQRMRNGLMLKTTAIPPPGCSNLSGCFHLKARCCPATRYARPLQPARLSVRASAYSPEQETDDASEPPRDAGGIEGMLQATQENVREAQDSKNGVGLLHADYHGSCWGTCNYPSDPAMPNMLYEPSGVDCSKQNIHELC